MKPSLTTTSAGSGTTAVLERAWEALRGLYPAIPPAILVILGAGLRGRERGYFGYSRWRVRRGKTAHHEVAISPRLFGSAPLTLATMVHEAAHASLWPDATGGVSGRDHRYHNMVFRDRARDFGLICTFVHTRYGWAHTSWPNGGPPPIYRPVLRILKTGLVAQVEAPKLPEGTPGKVLPRPGWTRLVCGCETANAIHVPGSVRERGGVRCTLCGEEFRPRS